MRHGSVLMHIVLVLALLALGAGAYFLITQKAGLPGLNNLQNSSKQSATCESDLIGVEVALPKGWTCSTEQIQTSDENMIIKSDFYNITIGTIGRGNACRSFSTDCVISDFYSNDKLKLQTWTVDGEDIEIYGTINDTTTWISIAYPNSTTQKLTASQKSDLAEVLDSIRTTN